MRKIRLFLRLNVEANEPVRALNTPSRRLVAVHRPGLRSVNFRMFAATRGVPGLTAVLSRNTNAGLRAAVRDRGCSITALANCNVENWFGKGHG